jgi:hypothetical protein
METEFAGIARNMKSPLPDCRRGPWDFRDDVDMRLICPTCQPRVPAAKIRGVREQSDTAGVRQLSRRK